MPGVEARRTDIATRIPKTQQKLDDLRRLGMETFEDALASVSEEAQRLPPPTATALVHGDLHFRHLLTEERQQRCGRCCGACARQRAGDNFCQPSDENCLSAAHSQPAR